MYKMLEVVGTSPVSHAEAIKQAIDTLRETEKVAWFEAVELRGGVHQGKIEFQAKLKVGVK